jgi:hypothetical protein
VGHRELSGFGRQLGQRRNVDSEGSSVFPTRRNFSKQDWYDKFTKYFGPVHYLGLCGHLRKMCAELTSRDRAKVKRVAVQLCSVSLKLVSSLICTVDGIPNTEEWVYGFSVRKRFRHAKSLQARSPMRI